MSKKDSNIITGSDLYLRHWEGTKSTVQQHRVWDGARFFQAQTDRCADENRKNPKAPPLRVETATREEYRQEGGR